MITKTKFIRIRWKDYLKMRELFPAVRGESVADYFGRLVAFMHENGLTGVKSRR